MHITVGNMKRLPNKTFQISNSLMATVLYCLLGTVNLT